MFNKFNYFLPNLKQSWIVCLFIVIVGAICAGILLAPLSFMIPEWEKSQLTMFIQYIVVMIPAFIYVYFKSKSAQEQGIEPIKIDRNNFGKLNIIVFCIISFLFIFSTNIIVEPLTSWIPMSESMRKMFEEMLRPGLFTFLTAVIAAPFLEEFFLRGIIARGLFNHTSALKGILWSSFLFALIHFNIWQGIGAFALGAFIGWIYYRTGSLKGAIAIHLINNLTSYILMTIFPDIDIESSFKDILAIYNPNLYIYVYLMSIIIVILSLMYLNKVLPYTNFKSNGINNNKENEQQTKSY